MSSDDEEIQVNFPPKKRSQIWKPPSAHPPLSMRLKEQENRMNFETFLPRELPSVPTRSGTGNRVHENASNSSISSKGVSRLKKRDSPPATNSKNPLYKQNGIPPIASLTLQDQRERFKDLTQPGSSQNSTSGISRGVDDNIPSLEQLLKLDYQKKTERRNWSKPLSNRAVEQERSKKAELTENGGEYLDVRQHEPEAINSLPRDMHMTPLELQKQQDAMKKYQRNLRYESQDRFHRRGRDIPPDPVYQPSASYQPASDQRRSEQARYQTSVNEYSRINRTTGLISPPGENQTATMESTSQNRSSNNCLTTMYRRHPPTNPPGSTAPLRHNDVANTSPQRHVMVNSESQARELLQLKQFSNVLEKQASNTTSLTSFSSPWSSRMQTKENRLNTFVNWHKEDVVDAESMADAGWFFTGPDDRVECPYCGGAVFNWVVGDTALGEHRRHFPQCSFIVAKINSSLQPVDSGILHRQLSAEDVYQTVEDCGYSRSAIDRAIAELEQEGAEITSENILNVLFEHIPDQDEEKEEEEEEEEEEQEQEPITSPNFYLEEENHQISNQSPKHESEASRRSEPKRDSQSADQSVTLLHTLKDFEELENKLTCKICLDAKMEVLFLPCRHLVCCADCAAMVYECPLCRAPIEGTVKVFM